MARRHQHADRGLVVHHGAVGAGVEPVFLRVAGDAVGAGADVAAAVQLVPDRRGELGHVDGVAGDDVLEDRAVVDDLVRDRLLLLEIGLAERVAQLPFAEMIGEAERHVAADAGEHVEQHAKALRAARHLVEHHAGAVLLAQDRLGGKPDVLLPARALDVAHLAEQLGAGQPLAQIVIGDVGVDVAFGRCCCCRSCPTLVERYCACCAALMPSTLAMSASWSRISLMPAANSAGPRTSTTWPVAASRLRDGGIGRDHRPDVGSDVLAQCARHAARAVDADQAVHAEVREARLGHGRHVGGDRRRACGWSPPAP